MQLKPSARLNSFVPWSRSIEIWEQNLIVETQIGGKRRRETVSEQLVLLIDVEELETFLLTGFIACFCPVMSRISIAERR